MSGHSGALRGRGVQWLEKPLGAWEADTPETLVDMAGLPTAAGENTLLPPGSDVQPWALAPFDILQPDLTKYAPLHVAMQLLERASATGKRVVPHCLGSAPALAASLHFAAGCEDPLVEMDINPNPLRTDLFEERFQIDDGAVEIPSRPGLGWRLRGCSYPCA